MSFTIMYNRATNHIAGLAIRTHSTGDEKGGVVANYSQNGCGTITRARLATGKEYSELAEALQAARIAGGRKLCRTCEKAAEAMLEAMKSEEPVTEEAPEVISWTGQKLTSVTVKGKKYLVTKLLPAGKTIDGEFVKNVREYVEYWSERNGETFGPVRNAYSDAKPGSVGRMLCDAMREPVAEEAPAPILADGWREVPHAVTGAVVGWLRPGEFRDVEKGMPVA